MSYIHGHVFDGSSTIPLIDAVHVAEPHIDHDLDSEQLPAILAILKQIDELDEGQTLVVWKELF